MMTMYSCGLIIILPDDAQTTPDLAKVMNTGYTYFFPTTPVIASSPWWVVRIDEQIYCALEDVHFDGGIVPQVYALIQRTDFPAQYPTTPPMYIYPSVLASPSGTWRA